MTNNMISINSIFLQEEVKKIGSKVTLPDRIKANKCFYREKSEG